MRRTLTLPLFFAIASLALLLGGCDDSPTSVEDFEVQPDVSVSGSSISFIAGQQPAPTFTVSYQGLESAPTAEASGGLTVEKVEETGTPENGSQTWAVSYDGDLAENTVSGTVTVRATGGGAEIVDEISVTVSNPVTVSEDFASLFAAVADYEDGQRETITYGGATAEVVTGDVAAGSNGTKALRLSLSAADSVVFERQTNAPDAEVFSFLLKPETSAAFDLTLTFASEAGGAMETFSYEVPVTAGGGWRKYAIALGQLFADFDPVAARAGGNGPLLSVAMSPSEDATFLVDDLAFGTSAGPTIEIDDFERTTNAYGTDSNITLADTSLVGPTADGPTARSLSWIDGGNFFGYNYERLRLDAGENGVLSLLVGEVSRAFDLYVFIETADGAGGFGYGSGVVEPVEAGGGFRTVEVPLSSLGGDLSALGDPGITNVGFEVRRRGADDITDPIRFVLDDVKLIAGE